jgi:hypothetical protein
MARESGVEALCYLRYRFSGRTAPGTSFQRNGECGGTGFPVLQLLRESNLDKHMAGAPDRVLIEQAYPGVNDHRRHSPSPPADCIVFP